MLYNVCIIMSYCILYMRQLRYRCHIWVTSHVPYITWWYSTADLLFIFYYYLFNYQVRQDLYTPSQPPKQNSRHTTVTYDSFIANVTILRYYVNRIHIKFGMSCAKCMSLCLLLDKNIRSDKLKCFS